MKHFLLVPLLLLLTLPSYAQNGYDYDKFVKEAGELSNIFRGQSTIIYNFRHTGTYYAYSEKFEKGSVKFNGKVYTNLTLNLNCHLDELNLLIDGTRRIMVLNNEFVEYFSFGGRNFVNMKELKQDSGIVGMEAGYYEILYNGSAKLYKRTKKAYAERINETINLETKSKIERTFLATESYYLFKAGLVLPVKKKSDLLSCYKDKKRNIRIFIRENELDLRNDKDHSFTEVIKFVESGTTKGHE